MMKKKTMKSYGQMFYLILRYKKMERILMMKIESVIMIMMQPITEVGQIMLEDISHFYLVARGV